MFETYCEHVPRLRVRPNQCVVVSESTRQGWGREGRKNGEGRRSISGVRNVGEKEAVVSDRKSGC
jgi:hypothetical protein